MRIDEPPRPMLRPAMIVRSSRRPPRLPVIRTCEPQLSQVSAHQCPFAGTYESTVYIGARGSHYGFLKFTSTGIPYLVGGYAATIHVCFGIRAPLRRHRGVPRPPSS